MSSGAIFVLLLVGFALIPFLVGEHKRDEPRHPRVGAEHWWADDQHRPFDWERDL